MSFIIERLAVVGVGLIGGSFAIALREAGIVKTVVGIGRSRANLEQALSLGIVDEISYSAAEGVKGAQLVFISVPVCSIPATVQEIAASLSPAA